MHKRIVNAMTVINNSNSLFEPFAKVVVGWVVFIYLCGFLWFPSIRNVAIYIPLILGLCFRFSFVINDELPKWKILTSCFFYIVVLLEQAYGFFLTNSSLDKIFTSFSVIVTWPVICAFFLDLWQFRKCRIS
jgi:hypothetical protein